MSRPVSEPKVARTSGGDIQVWDIVVRVFHWTIVVGCVLDLFVFEDGKTVHRLIGYIVASALIVRLVWGFLGPKHARFPDFVPTSAKLGQYFKALLRGEEPRYLGHNPTGAVVMLALMGLLAAVSI